jgi:hypothetical protein
LVQKIGSFQLKDKDGNILIEVKWNLKLDNNLLKWPIVFSDIKTGKYSILDSNWKIILKWYEEIWMFSNWITNACKSSRWDGGNSSYIREDWTVLKDGFVMTSDFKDWFSVFQTKNNKYWWMKDDGTILKDGLNWCWKFKWNVAVFCEESKW